MFRNIGKKEDYKEFSKFGKSTYRIMWNYQPIMINEYDESESENNQYEDPVFASWMQETFFEKPDVQQIKNIILNNINSEIDKKILNGFSWDDGNGTVINVYLSSENQFNYKAAYDLAYQTNGKSLPFVLKFGEIDDPQYYMFNDLDKFTDFYTSCINFINSTLQEGWSKKDSIDWTKYEEPIEIKKKTRKSKRG